MSQSQRLLDVIFIVDYLYKLQELKESCDLSNLFFLMYVKALFDDENSGKPELLGDCDLKVEGSKFTSKELDDETGLYYFGARYYDQKVSRWMSTDQALNSYISNDKKEKLPSGGVYNPLNINVYNYALNNPMIYNDPDGNVPQVVVAIAIGAAIALGVSTTCEVISNYRNDKPGFGGFFLNTGDAIRRTFVKDDGKANWKSMSVIGASTVIGGVTAGSASYASGAISSLVASSTTSGTISTTTSTLINIGVNTTAGGLGSGVDYTVHNLITGEKITPQGVLTSTATGAGVSLLSSSVGSLISNKGITTTYDYTSGMRNPTITHSESNGLPAVFGTVSDNAINAAGSILSNIGGSYLYDKTIKNKKP